MPSNLAIDDELLDEALRLGGHRTKKATVNEALKEYMADRYGMAILTTDEDFPLFARHLPVRLHVPRG